MISTQCAIKQYTCVCVFVRLCPVLLFPFLIILVMVWYGVSYLFSYIHIHTIPYIQSYICYSLHQFMLIFISFFLLFFAGFLHLFSYFILFFLFIRFPPISTSTITISIAYRNRHHHLKKLFVAYYKLLYIFAFRLLFSLFWYDCRYSWRKF